VPALILASVPMNSEAGSYMTFGAPVGLFAVVATILWVLFSRPHRRIPPRRPVTASAGAASGQVAPAAAAAGGAGNVSGAVATSGSSANGESGAAAGEGGAQSEDPPARGTTPDEGAEAS
jgi:hypothetical protein